MTQDRFDQRWLASAAHGLSEHIGPMGRIIVKQVAETAVDAADLLDRLAAEIDDPEGRRRFLTQLGPPPGDGEPMLGPGTQPAAHEFDDELLARAERDLAGAIGPIAGILVRRAAGRAKNAQELYRMLALEIDDQTERNQFLLRDR